jgi:hypothetical protein
VKIQIINQLMKTCREVLSNYTAPPRPHLECQLKLQEFGIAGSPIAIQFSIFWVPFNGFCIVLHGLGIIPWMRKIKAFL